MERSSEPNNFRKAVILVETTSKLCMTVSEAATQLNISRSKLYQLLRENAVPSIRVGRKILIPTEELREWLHLTSTHSSNLKSE